MAKVKNELAIDRWQRWKSVQLTDDERAELRREAEAELDRARSSGVYERLLHLRGKVKFSLT